MYQALIGHNTLNFKTITTYQTRVNIHSLNKAQAKKYTSAVQPWALTSMFLYVFVCVWYITVIRCFVIP